MTAPPSPSDSRPPARVCILGAPGDTGNLGVTALLHGTLTGLASLRSDLDITVFDNGLGVRREALTVAGASMPYRLLGLRVSRRYHRPESLTNVRLSAKLGGLANPVARALLAADAVLDISGGDSFSDLYPRGQQRLVVQPKRLVLGMGRPLILLPQTYGPFSGERARLAATAILRRAEAAWARDHDSYLALQALLGDTFDPTRHREGVDVAFRLEPTPPSRPLPTELAAWLTPDRVTPVLGVNISGLLCSDDAGARYGLASSYRALMHALVERVLEETQANVVLVPHVLGSGLSDEQATADVLAAVPPRYRHRVLAAPAMHIPGEAKWLIGQLDWFCGARMHATIAALSSGVPTAGLAYSPKMRGVFACCGLERDVVDLRRCDERTALARLLRSWHQRGDARRRLARTVPGVLRAADDQAQEFVSRIRPSHGRAVPTTPQPHLAG